MPGGFPGRHPLGGFQGCQPVLAVFLNLKTAVGYLDSPGSAFFLNDFQLLRSLTLRVKTQAPAAQAGRPQNAMVCPTGACRSVLATAAFRLNGVNISGRRLTGLASRTYIAMKNTCRTGFSRVRSIRFRSEVPKSKRHWAVSRVTSPNNREDTTYTRVHPRAPEHRHPKT